MMYRCRCGGSEYLRPRWCDFCQSRAVIPFDPDVDSLAPYDVGVYNERRPFVYNRGRVGFEISPLFFGLGVACRGLWWLLRGSAYGIGLCLRGQLRVPLEGWRDIGRGARAVYQVYRKGDFWEQVMPVIMVVYLDLVLILMLIRLVVS